MSICCKVYHHVKYANLNFHLTALSNIYGDQKCFFKNPANLLAYCNYSFVLSQKSKGNKTFHYWLKTIWKFSLKVGAVCVFYFNRRKSLGLLYQNTTDIPAHLAKKCLHDHLVIHPTALMHLLSRLFSFTKRSDVADLWNNLFFWMLTK